MTSKDLKKIILEKLRETLAARQFKKRGNTFMFSNGDLTYFIGLQSSQSSTSDVLKVTINTEIASALIAKLDVSSLPFGDRRQYNKRIGFYLDDNFDKWWTIINYDNAESAANEIVKAVTDRVIPIFQNLKTTYDLAALWRNGDCTGITDGQRKYYLSLIDAVNN